MQIDEDDQRIDDQRHLLGDDTFMVVFNVVLWQLTRVFLGNACQYILDKGLLQQHIATVFLILENPLYALGRPLFVSSCSQNPARFQFLFNGQ